MSGEGKFVEVGMGVEGREGDVALESELDQLFGLFTHFQQPICKVVSLQGFLGLFPVEVFQVILERKGNALFLPLEGHKSEEQLE